MRSMNDTTLSYNTTVLCKLSPAFEEVIRLSKLTAIYSKPKPKKMISSLSYSLTSANSIRRTFKGFAPTEFSKRKLKAEKEKAAKKKEKKVKQNHLQKHLKRNNPF